MKVLHVVGARPNFMKLAPVLHALDRRGLRQVVIHTGQHYDPLMSDVFFQQLGIPQPDVNLEIGSGSHAAQSGQVMIAFEGVVIDEQPDFVCVYGDVNSTMAAAIDCAKLGICVAHVEAGLRSFDRTMPEEINRIITDQIADLLFTPSRDGNENLIREGIAPERIHFVGNVMIDTLVRLLPEAETAWKCLQPRLPLRHRSRGYALVTLHRPSNVDDPRVLEPLIQALNDISHKLPVLFPVHPRTRSRMQDYAGVALHEDFHLLEPCGYVDFLALQRSATVVITDSGGIQEETTFLGVPCLTVRENTERPVTVTHGTNVLVGRDIKRLVGEIDRILAGKRQAVKVPELWDGQAGERIADVLVSQA